MLKNGTSLLPRVSRNAQSQIRAASRAFAANARASYPSAPATNTAGVDPRVLDGEVLLPKANMDRLCEWQSGLWERLAKEVRNNPALLDVKQKWDKDGLDIVHLLDKTARDPSLGLAFNYASLLLNNSFFLEGMTGDESPFPEGYGGKETSKMLTEKLQAYAEGIVGGGWLWLVRVGNESKALDIVPTFAAGTLLVSQRAQQGREDVSLFLAPHTASPASASTSASSSEPTVGENGVPLNQATTGSVKKAQNLARPDSLTNTKNKITPLAVLNLYETAWLGDKYGVWGKRQYASDWFKTLDWSRLIARGK